MPSNQSVKRSLPPSNVDSASKRAAIDKGEDGVITDRSNNSGQVVLSNTSIKKSAFVNPAAIDKAKTSTATTSIAEIVPVSSSNNNLKNEELPAKVLQSASESIPIRTEEIRDTTQSDNENVAYSEDNINNEDNVTLRSHEQQASGELLAKNTGLTNLKRTRLNEPQTVDKLIDNVETDRISDETPNRKKQKV